MKVPSKQISLIVLSLILPTSSISSFARDVLKPLLAIPDSIALENVFSKSEPLAKGVWQQRQHTRWKIEDGVLRGIPSTLEYQNSITHHQGLEPRISCPATPDEFVAKFSIRFIGGVETSIAPFIEFGHHVARIKFSESGTSLIGDGESVKLDEAKDFKYESGKWYHCLAELKGEEFVIQFKNGPTLYARHPSFRPRPPKSGGAGFGTAGPKGGTVEIDNLTLWTIKKGNNPNWAATQKLFPKFRPITLKEKSENDGSNRSLIPVIADLYPRFRS